MLSLAETTYLPAMGFSPVDASVSKIQIMKCNQELFSMLRKNTHKPYFSKIPIHPFPINPICTAL